jgi:hypothetical protein
MSSFSVYIPRVFSNISNNKIIGTFERLQLGKVDTIDVVWKTGRDGNLFKMVFVHFSEWNMSSSSAVKLRENIEDPNTEAKLIYDEPWYWIILPNTSCMANQVNQTNHVNQTNPVNQDNQTNQTTVHFQSNNLNTVQSDWLERIANLEDELTYIYEELYNREYIPVKYRPVPVECNLNKMSMSELNTSYHNSRCISPMSMDELDVFDDTELHITELHTPPLGPPPGLTLGQTYDEVQPYDDDIFDSYSANELCVDVDDNYDYYNVDLQRPSKLARVGSYLGNTSGPEHGYGVLADTNADTKADTKADIKAFIPLTTINAKIWMTANCCDNA